MVCVILSFTQLLSKPDARKEKQEGREADKLCKTDTNYSAIFEIDTRSISENLVVVDNKTIV